MRWDSHTGATGAWAGAYDIPPFVYPERITHCPQNNSYNGSHYARVPVVRWTNPSSKTMVVALTAAEGFRGLIHKLPTGTVADIIIARTDASDGGSVHLLYSQTITKTLAESELEWFELDPLNIQNLVLNPGDDIIFSVMCRTPFNSDLWQTVAFDDRVNITVVPSRPRLPCSAWEDWR
jgi:hypothetical protein